MKDKMFVHASWKRSVPLGDDKLIPIWLKHASFNQQGMHLVYQAVKTPKYFRKYDQQYIIIINISHIYSITQYL